MPRGGKRAGAGRKKGQSWGGMPEKKNRLPYIASPETRERLLELTPMDVMVKTMTAYVDAARILGEKVVDVDGKIIRSLSLLKQAAEIARDCAPYVHAKMATKLEHGGPDGGPIAHKIIAEIVQGGAVGR